MRIYRSVIKIVTVILLAVPAPGLAVKTAFTIAVPPGQATNQITLNLTIPSGTQKSTRDQNSPITIVPVSGQPSQLNIELDLNEGDGLYNVINENGESFGAIPVNDDKVVDSVLDTLEASRTDIRITTRDRDGNRQPATVTVTEVWGNPQDLREYTRDTGAEGTGTINGATGNLYRITVTYQGRTFIRYQHIQSDMNHIDINVDDPGIPSNQLLTIDNFYRQNGYENGLQAVRQEHAWLHNYFQNATGMHILSALPQQAQQQVQQLIGGFISRLQGVPSTRDPQRLVNQKLQIIKEARHRLSGPRMEYADPNAVKQAQDTLDALEQFYRSPNYDAGIDFELRGSKGLLDQRDAQSRAAQYGGSQTRQVDEPQQATRQPDAASGDIGLYNANGEQTGVIKGDPNINDNLPNRVRAVTTPVSPYYTGVDLSKSWAGDSNWSVGLRYAQEIAGAGNGGLQQQFATSGDAGYSDYFESRVGLNFEKTQRITVSAEGDMAQLFAGIFDMEGKGAGRDTGYRSDYVHGALNGRWQPSIASPWDPGIISGGFLGDLQQSGDSGTLKGRGSPDDWAQDSFSIGADFKLDAWNIGGRIDYKFTGSKYNDTLWGRQDWNSMSGKYNQRLDLNIDFQYESDTGELTPEQQNAVQYKGSYSNVTSNWSTYRIGRNIYAGFITHTLNDPPPQTDVGDFRMGYKTTMNLEQTFKNFNAAKSRQVKAAAGARGRSVADPPAQTKRLPNDGFFHSKGSWGQKFDDQWGLKRIGFTDSNRNGKGSLWPRKGKPVVVAVVDSGIDFGHPELAGTLWLNEKDNPNNDKDDDKNQLKNDFVGWNFVRDNNNTFDDNGHGTFVAGIIAARTDNGLGMAGINPWALIMPVKVADMFGDSNDIDVAQGIAYAARMGAKVINVSIGGRGLSKIEQAAVDEAVKSGALVVVAAGNENEDLKDISPASLQGVITVTATDQNDKRTKYSNWGASADIAAPGEEILSLRAIQTDLLQFFDRKYKPGSNIMGTYRNYYRLSGTSFAAPYVAGVASLLLSLQPELKPEQVKRMILHSAKDIEIPGIDQFTGYGLLDAAAALKADPEFFVEARIDKIAVAQADGKQVVQVGGRADADQFGTAWVEIGAGEEPQEWKRVAENVAKTAATGILANIPAQSFAGSKTWIIKLVTEHKNGKKRENRFVLKVG